MIERLRDILQSSWFRRTVLALYVSLLSITIGIYIGISMLEVRTAVFFRGDAEIEKGRPNAVRGVVLNAKTGRFRRKVAVDFVLTGPDVEETDDSAALFERAEFLGSTRPSDDGVVELPLEVPEEVEPGDYRLWLRARGPAIDDYTANRKVEVVEKSEDRERWLPQVSRIADEKRRERFSRGPIIEESGAIAIDVLPLDGEVPRGLPGNIYLVTYDAETGEPVSATVTFDKVEGIGQWGGQADLPTQVETDALGLAPISLEAVGGQKWTVTADETAEREEGEERIGTATIEIHTVASQMALELDRPFVRPGGDITGDLHSLFRSGALQLDLYRGRPWLLATHTSIGDGRTARVEIGLPDNAGSDGWLYRIQASRGVYGAGASWDVVHVLAPPANRTSALRGTLGRLTALIAENRDEHPYFQYLADEHLVRKIPANRARIVGWTAAMTHALPRHFSRPGTLFNNQKAERKALETWIDEAQSDLMIPIIAALVGGLAVLLYVGIAGWRRKREHEQHLKEIDDDLAMEAEASGEASGLEEASEVETEAGGDLLAWLLAVVALATLVMFGLGLLLLLTYL